MKRVRVIVILGLIAVLTVPSIFLNLVVGTDLLGFSLAAFLFVVVGTFLVIKVPHNRVGTILAIGGTAWLLYTSAGEYGRISLQSEAGSLPGEHLAGWIGSWLGPVLPASLAALLLVFPDGRPPRGWRWLVVALLTLVVTAVVGSMMLWDLPVTVLTDFGALDREPRYLLVDLAFIGGFAAVLPATASLVMRYRRGGHVQRQQIKWLLAVAVFFASVFVIGNVLFSDAWPIWEWMVAISMALVPVAVAFAVARYRLYDIDRIISRTLSYALVVGVLAAIFFGLITLLAGLLSPDQPLVVAGSTLAVFALFNPLRRRVQIAVDRRFNRSRYDTERVIESFTGTLRDRVDPDGVVDGWVGVVSETMQPTTVVAWVKETGS